MGIIIWLRNFWAAIPAGLQAIVQLLLAAVWTVAVAYNWRIPSSIQDAYTVAAGFALAVFAVVLPIVKDKLIPWLVAWFLSNGVIVTAKGTWIRA